MVSQHVDEEARLLAELARALRDTDTPGAELVARTGKAAFALRTMDEELAAMVYDSLLDDDALVGARAGRRERTLVFEADGVSIEIEVNQDGLVGQVVPAGAGSVLAELDDGATTSAQTDELGCFALATPSAGRVRLHVRAGSWSVVTEWTQLTPRP